MLANFTVKDRTANRGVSFIFYLFYFYPYLSNFFFFNCLFYTLNMEIASHSFGYSFRSPRYRESFNMSESVKTNYSEIDYELEI